MHGRQARDLLGELERTWQHLVRRDHVVRKPQLVRPLSADGVTAQHDLHTGQPREIAQDRHECRADDPGRQLRHREPRVVRVHGDVRPQHHVPAEAPGAAVDGGDDRLVRVGNPQVLHPCDGRVRRIERRRTPGRLVLDVPPGAEDAAGAGQHTDTRVVVVDELVPGPGEVVPHLRSTRIQSLGAVHRHGRDMPALLVFDEPVRCHHSVPPRIRDSRAILQPARPGDDRTRSPEFPSQAHREGARRGPNPGAARAGVPAKVQPPTPGPDRPEGYRLRFANPILTLTLCGTLAAPCRDAAERRPSCAVLSNRSERAPSLGVLERRTRRAGYPNAPLRFISLRGERSSQAERSES